MTEQRRLIVGGRIFTGDPEIPWAEAAVVEDNCFAFVGSSREAVSFAGPAAEKIDCAGELVLPGFVDGHVHVVMTGASLLKAQLRDAVGLEQIQGRIRDWASEHRDAPRVLATGWVQGSLEEGAPTREMLDAVVDDRPVYVAAHDLHSCWVNSAALQELKITNSTPDPVGGRIVRNADTGEATGPCGPEHPGELDRDARGRAGAERHGVASLYRDRGYPGPGNRYTHGPL